MNEGVVSALMTGGMPVLAALLTLLVAQWFNAKSQAKQVEERRTERRDNDREWYRRTLFEKRLAAVQEAYAWLQKIKEAIDNANPNDPQSVSNDVLRKTAREAREWYDKNTIPFHDEFPEGSLFIGLINSSFGYSYGRTPLMNTEDELGVLHHYLAAKTMIRERARKLLELESERQGSNER